MPKIILPFQGLAAAGKNGVSPSSLIYARTKVNTEAQKMVTYTKAYKKPVQPNTPAQIFCREKFYYLMKYLRVFQSYWKAGTLHGIGDSDLPSFVNSRSLYISQCLKDNMFIHNFSINILHGDGRLQANPFYVDAYLSFFEQTKFWIAYQTRGGPTFQQYYRNSHAIEIANMTDQTILEGQGVHFVNKLNCVDIINSEFTVGSFYMVRVFVSPTEFPPPPADPDIDATSIWSLPNSVRYDILVECVA